MKFQGNHNPKVPLFKEAGIKPAVIYANQDPEFLIRASIEAREAREAACGAIAIQTGKYTGRSPLDKFMVIDDLTSSTVDWGKVNQPFDPVDYDQLKQKMIRYLDGKTLYLQDVAACADPSFRLPIRVLAEKPWSAHFAYNMFLRMDSPELLEFIPDWHILCVPSFKAEPEQDHTRSENFAIINMTAKEIIIGGTGYTGEIKKSIFTVLNYLLPKKFGVLPMHCSANEGKNGDVAVFFGLSGTGKTTLSADPERQLIGDDEHGWSDQGIFNFEGGCYAKCIGLSAKKEPQIFAAIKPGAILENITFKGETSLPDYDDASITQNTRVSYPIHHISNAKISSQGGHPKHIFFLTCDAFGVLPPISLLTPGQAMYHFISGYTAKVAGTETGVVEPQLTFSACFGAPFLPLHPTVYAEMLGSKMRDHQTKVWLVNTGWTGGPYGKGERIKLKYTRAMIKAAIGGALDNVRYAKMEPFHLQYPSFCPGVPTDVLNPRNTWEDSLEYDKKASYLADMFSANFARYAEHADKEIIDAGPKNLASII